MKWRLEKDGRCDLARENTVKTGMKTGWSVYVLRTDRFTVGAERMREEDSWKRLTDKQRLPKLKNVNNQS